MELPSPAPVQTTRVVIADDQALIRAGVRALVEKIERLEVVAETGNGGELVALTEAHQPDLILFSIRLPAASAFKIVAQLKRVFSGVRIIVIGTNDDEADAAAAFRAGALGYLPKSAAGAELLRAVDSVRRGIEYLPPGFSSRTLFERPEAAPKAKAIGGLTPRQHQVLKLIAEGHNTRQIAGVLGISVKTVESHRTQLMERLKIHDVVGLVRYALRRGMVKIEGYEADLEPRQSPPES